MNNTVSLFPIWEYVLRALQYACDWLIKTLVGPVFDGVIRLLGPHMPSGSFDISSFIDSSTYTFLCMWFPCSFAITCFLSYLAIAVLVYSINWILGLIPTVS